MVQINNNSHWPCNTNSQIKFKNTILKSRLGDYCDVYIFVKGTMSVANTAASYTEANDYNIKLTALLHKRNKQ